MKPLTIRSLWLTHAINIMLWKAAKMILDLPASYR